MSQQHSSRPTILPVPKGVTRPLWSVMIPTYNCAGYLRETLASVLAQDPGSDIMQIMVVDDHSQEDDPAAVVAELGKGRVEFYRQPKNVGITKNFQTCLELARGELIHQLHGDDLVQDGFYKKMGQGFEQHPEIGAAFCRNIFMDEYSDWQSLSNLEQRKSGVLPSDWLVIKSAARIILWNGTLSQLRTSGSQRLKISNLIAKMNLTAVRPLRSS